jgi:hypothetical protein
MEQVIHAMVACCTSGTHCVHHRNAHAVVCVGEGDGKALHTSMLRRAVCSAASGAAAAAAASASAETLFNSALDVACTVV